jgi:Ca2+-binding RTX toxin-like protein
MASGTRTSLLGVLAFALVVTLVIAPAAEARRIVGNNNANRLFGTMSRDDVFGGKGKDILVGRAGSDRLHGEEGDDIIVGGSGRDTIWGDGRDDTLYGGAGADRIHTGWGTDVVEAGPGNDIVYARENDASMDSIDCGNGWDTAYVNRGDRVFNCETVVRTKPGKGKQVPGKLWMGTDVGETLGGPMDAQVRDLIVGLGGNDTLNGHAYPDILWGNDGLDVLMGGHGPDLLLGGPGDDSIDGEAGNDRLWGGIGEDVLLGGRHNDEIISLDQDGLPDVIDCGPGRDRAVVVAGEDVDVTNCEIVIRIKIT